jgi:hypothetical protein
MYKIYLTLIFLVLCAMIRYLPMILVSLTALSHQYFACKKCMIRSSGTSIMALWVVGEKKLKYFKIKLLRHTAGRTRAPKKKIEFRTASAGVN